MFMNYLYCLLLITIPISIQPQETSKKNNTSDSLELISHVARMISTVWKKAGSNNVTRILRDLTPAVIISLFLKVFILKDKKFDYDAFMKILTNNNSNSGNNNFNKIGDLSTQQVIDTIKNLKEEQVQSILENKDNQIIFENALENHGQLLGPVMHSEEIINHEEENSHT